MCSIRHIASCVLYVWRDAFTLLRLPLARDVIHSSAYYAIRVASGSSRLFLSFSPLSPSPTTSPSLSLSSLQYSIQQPWSSFFLPRRTPLLPLSEQPFFFLSLDNGDGKENGLTSCVAIIVSFRPVSPFVPPLRETASMYLPLRLLSLARVTPCSLCFSPPGSANSDSDRACVRACVLACVRACMPRRSRIILPFGEIQSTRDQSRISEYTTRAQQNFALVTTLSPWPPHHSAQLLPLPSRRSFLSVASELRGS